MIDNAKLTEIKERADNATAGPWTHSKLDDTIEKFNDFTTKWQVIASNVSDNDAVFIAQSRQDIPKLVYEVERLRKALEFYASNESYEYWPSYDRYIVDVLEDGGNTAREALK